MMFKTYKKNIKEAKKNECVLFHGKILGEEVALLKMTSVLVIPHNGKLETSPTLEVCQWRICKVWC